MSRNEQTKTLEDRFHSEFLKIQGVDLEEPIILIENVTAEEYNQLDDETLPSCKFDWKSHQDNADLGDIWVLEMLTIEHQAVERFIVIKMGLGVGDNPDLISVGAADIRLPNSSTIKRPDCSYIKGETSTVFFLAEIAVSQSEPNVEEKIGIFSRGLETLECALYVKVFRDSRQLKIVKYIRNGNQWKDFLCEDGIVRFENVEGFENVLINFNLLIANRIFAGYRIFTQ